MFIDHNGIPHLGDQMPGERPATAEEEAAFLANHARMVARDRINNERDVVLAAGVEWDGRRWQADDVMRSALQWRITRWQMGRLPVDAVKVVRDFTNSNHALSFDDHVALAEAIEAAAETIYGQSWAAKDAL